MTQSPRNPKILKEVNQALDKVENCIKTTIATYYDNIEVNKFVTYDQQDDYLVGEFIAKDGRSLLFQINREGVPDLVEKTNG